MNYLNYFDNPHVIYERALWGFVIIKPVNPNNLLQSLSYPKNRFWMSRISQSSYFYCQTFPHKDQNQQWFDLTNKYDIVYWLLYSLFFFAIELHCCQKNIKNHQWAKAVATAWHVHYHEHSHFSSFWVDPTYTIYVPSMWGLKESNKQTNARFTPVWVTFATQYSA